MPYFSYCTKIKRFEDVDIGLLQKQIEARYLQKVKTTLKQNAFKNLIIGLDLKLFFQFQYQQDA